MTLLRPCREQQLEELKGSRAMELARHSVHGGQHVFSLTRHRL